MVQLSRSVVIAITTTKRGGGGGRAGAGAARACCDGRDWHGAFRFIISCHFHLFFILVVSAAVVFCLCPEPVLAAASSLSRACLGNRTQNTVSFCFRFVFVDPQGLNLNIKRVIFTTLEKYLLSRRTFVYKPMDLNRDWSPCSLRRGIKTAAFERKRPEL